VRGNKEVFSANFLAGIDEGRATHSACWLLLEFSKQGRVVQWAQARGFEDGGHRPFHFASSVVPPEERFE
jgi:hypothetical protein